MRSLSACRKGDKRYEEIVQFGSGHVFRAVRDEHEQGKF